MVLNWVFIFLGITIVASFHRTCYGASSSRSFPLLLYLKKISVTAMGLNLGLPVKLAHAIAENLFF
jgi:hypothetical protein